MVKVNTHQTMTSLLKLLAGWAARASELWPAVRRSRAPRRPGMDSGRIWIAGDFDDPLPDEVQKYFE